MGFIKIELKSVGSELHIEVLKYGRYVTYEICGVSVSNCYTYLHNSDRQTIEEKKNEIDEFPYRESRK
jgi:hypothetical protein